MYKGITIATQALSGQEAMNSLIASLPTAEFIQTIIKSSSPFYYLVLRLSFILFGNYEIVSRGLSLFLLIASAIVFYIIALSLWGKKTALISTIILLCNPLLFEYAFTVTPHVTLVFLVLLSTLLFIKKKHLLYLLISFCAYYTNPSVLLIIIAQYVWILYELIIGKRMRVVRRLKYLIIFLILVGPGLWVYVNSVTPINNAFALERLLQDLLVLVAGKNTFYLSFIEISREYLFGGIVGLILILRKWNSHIVSTIRILILAIIPLTLQNLILYYSLFDIPIEFLVYTIPFFVLIISTGRKKISYVFLGIYTTICIMINYFTFVTSNTPPLSTLDLGKIVVLDDEIPLYWQLSYYGKDVAYYPKDAALGKIQSYYTPQNVIHTLESDEISIATNKSDDITMLSNYDKVSEEDLETFSIVTYKKR